MRTMIAAVAALALIGSLHGAARAAPSGGGGSMPSAGGVQRNSADPARAYREGVEALQARDYETAVSRLRTAQRAIPNDATVNYVYALALIGNGDADEAKRPLERAVRAPNAVPDAHLQLGLLQIQDGERDGAIAQQQALAAMLASCDAACGDQRRAQIQAAHTALTNALAGAAAPAANPETSWLPPGEAQGRAAYATAVGLINSERYGDALLALGRAQEAIGPHPDVLNYLGFVNRKLGRHESALGYYQEALALDPDHLGATEYLGELYLEMGRVEDARVQLARLDRLCPYGCAEREELARWIVLASR